MFTWKSFQRISNLDKSFIAAEHTFFHHGLESGRSIKMVSVKTSPSPMMLTRILRICKPTLKNNYAVHKRAESEERLQKKMKDSKRVGCAGERKATSTTHKDMYCCSLCRMIQSCYQHFCSQIVKSTTNTNFLWSHYQITDNMPTSAVMLLIQLYLLCHIVTSSPCFTNH